MTRHDVVIDIRTAKNGRRYRVVKDNRYRSGKRSYPRCEFITASTMSCQEAQERVDRWTKLREEGKAFQKWAKEDSARRHKESQGSK